MLSFHEIWHQKQIFKLCFLAKRPCKNTKAKILKSANLCRKAALREIVQLNKKLILLTSLQWVLIAKTSSTKVPYNLHNLLIKAEWVYGKKLRFEKKALKWFESQNNFTNKWDVKTCVSILVTLNCCITNAQNFVYNSITIEIFEL